MDTAIQKLQEKEAQLKAKEAELEENGLWAKRGDKRTTKDQDKPAKWRQRSSSPSKGKKLY